MDSLSTPSRTLYLTTMIGFTVAFGFLKAYQYYYAKNPTNPNRRIRNNNNNNANNDNNTNPIVANNDNNNNNTRNYNGNFAFNSNDNSGNNNNNNSNKKKKNNNNNNNNNNKKKSNPGFTASDLRNTRKSILLYCDINKDKSVTISQDALDVIDKDKDLLNYVQSVVKSIPPKDNPNSLDQFNYQFKNGKLCTIDTEQGFHWVNQAHYDALGDVIVTHIQQILISKYKLNEVFIPLRTANDSNSSTTTGDTTVADSGNLEVNPSKNTITGVIPQCNIFVSQNAMDCDHLVLLVQGSGAVRAGQWARALCINEDLSIGTIFPYIEECQKRGWGIIVFNPNFNEIPEIPTSIKRTSFLTTEKVLQERPKMLKIPQNSNFIEHNQYVWENFVRKSNSKKISIVAHSRGGDGTLELIKKYVTEFEDRVISVAFTDSVHTIERSDPQNVKQFLQQRGKHWIASSKPLGEYIKTPSGDCMCVSAGHDKHEYTSGFAITEVFKYFDERATKDPKQEQANN